MRQRWLGLLALAGFVSCVVPRYSVIDDGFAGGPSGGAGATAAGSHGAGVAGSTTSSGGDDATGGTSVDPGSDCGQDQKRCGAECVPVSDVTYGCTPTSCNQSACPAGAASLACEANQCVIASCATDQKSCGGRCVSVSDPTYGCSKTGCDAVGCPAVSGSETLVCMGSSCMVGTCGADTKKCDNKCVPLDAANGCAATSCDACDATEVCSGSPSQCACIPDDAEACKGQTCGLALNNCGDSVPCQDTCTAPTPACSGNQCVECNAAGDCPSVPCAKATCTNHQCGFTVATAGSKCTGGACSTTKAGICTRPQITVDTFKIDATEVTRGQYLAFLDAKQGNTSGQPASCSWNTSYTPTASWPPEIPDYEMPVTFVDWCDANAYCAWAGGRLCGKIGGGAGPPGQFDDPTLYQWMRACSGASNYAYPYGNSYDEARCNVDYAAPVASFPGCVGGYPGLYDMSGNVLEWEDSCSGGHCGLRGSNYDLGILEGGARLRCDLGQVDDPKVTHARVGFRCCSSP